jgi:hypothetical protein
MRKETYRLQRIINDDIKVGDLVKLIDGSALTCDKIERPIIVRSYENVLGSVLDLKLLTFKVIRTNIDNAIVYGVLDICYLQDIEVEYNNVVFRTASSLVTKIK